jgi:mono/diheme cytochrome c family protein
MTPGSVVRLLTVAAAAALLIPAAASATGDAAKGKADFEMDCASCHGTSGKGDGPVGKALTPPPRDFTKGVFKYDTDGDGKTGTDADLHNIIKNGAMKYGGNPMMAGWPQLSDEQIDNIIAYVRTLKQ